MKISEYYWVKATRPSLYTVSGSAFLCSDSMSIKADTFGHMNEAILRAAEREVFGQPLYLFVFGYEEYEIAASLMACLAEDQGL